MQEQRFTEDNITYHVIPSARRRRSLSIRITAVDTVEISVPPRASMGWVRQALDEKREWILRQLWRRRNQPQPADLGENALYLGKDYTVRTVRSPHVLLPKLEHTPDGFILSIPDFYTKEQQATAIPVTFRKWYVREATTMLRARAGYYSARTGWEFADLKVKEVSTIWGSCSHDQRLTFNWKLIMAPLEVLDYVVVHEICHLRHKHHQQSFWDAVAKLDPLYNVHRRWLKRNSSGLEIE